MKKNTLQEPLKGRLWIGTSNITLPGTKKDFPENFQSSSRLTYYGSLFNSLEINSSFYKVPRPATFERWSAETPAPFKFTVKLWKQVTHVKQLKFRLQDIDFFMRAANCVNPAKKGCLLIQFPASITASYVKQLEKILQRIQLRDRKQQWQKCVEFRHNSWYNSKVHALLIKYHAALVLHDMPASRLHATDSPVVFINLRFHGVKGDYRGSYTLPQLKKYAAKIKNWMKQGKEVYAYFNNTIGDAFENARMLQALCNGPK